MSDVMKGYKGFKKGLICNPNGKPKQYAENTVFEEDSAVICQSGMHYCVNPLDVLDYYPLIDENGDFIEVAEVEALDEPKTDDNKKFCTKKLKVGAKLEFSAFIKAAINFVFEKTEIKKDNSGNYAQLASSGDYAKLASSGDYAQLASSGYYAKLASSGNSAKLASSGYSAQLASSGNSAQLASSGNSAKLASSGYYAKLASSGNYAQLASSGDFAQLASSGNSAQLASSGNSAKLASSGYYAVIAGIGADNIAKGKKGSWITLAEWKFDDDKNFYVPVCVKTRKIDGRRIKEDTFYKLENGKFVEVAE